jgi:hypothetical protein
VLVLWAVIDEQQQAHRPQGVDEPIEERLTLGVDPVEVFEQDDHGLTAALVQQQHPHRFQRAVTALLGVEAFPPRVIDRGAEEPEARRHEGLEGHVEGRQLADDHLSRLERRLVLRDLEVGAEAR